MLDFLYATEENDLPLAISALTAEDIQNFCLETIYHRGVGYYDIGAVKDISYTGTHELIASVQVNRKYDVLIQWSNKNVSTICSCPYEDVCKHIIAVLLHALLEKVDAGNIIELNDTSLSNYLAQLSKKELIDLVERFAPKEFRTVIQNQFVPEDKSMELVAKVVKKVDQVLANSDLYWDPTDMEHALEKQLKKLKGFENKASESIYQLLITIVNKVNELTEEGYLYNSYYDDQFDESQIDEFTHNFLKELSLDKKIEYINGFESVINNSEYPTFEGILTNIEVLFKGEEAGLKEILIENIKDEDYRHVEVFYPVTEPLLSIEERAFILSRVHHLSASLSIKLAKFFEQEGKIEPAIGVLKDCMEKQDFWSVKETVYTELLRLKHIDQSLEESFADQMLVELSDKKTLRLVTLHFPNRKHHFEELLQTKSALELLEYLEEENRLKEALQIVMDNDMMLEDRKYSFFKQHNSSFPEQAKTYFVKRINDNLKHTGNEYYGKIANTLKSLQAIDHSQAIEIKEMIKSNYKRRTNLMKLL